MYPFAEVSDKYGYTIPVIEEIFDERAAELEASRGTTYAPKCLAIDEKHVQKKARGVFVNNDTGTLLEITENNKRQTVIDTIQSFDGYENIKYVTMDMANGYKSIIQEILPNATIIVDHYHVIQDLLSKITASKKMISTHLEEKIMDMDKRDPSRKQLLAVLKLAGDPYLFKYNKSTLSTKGTQSSIMAKVCSTFPEFNHLRLIKEGVEAIYECSNRKDAEALYLLWEDLVPPKLKSKTREWETEVNVPRVYV